MKGTIGIVGYGVVGKAFANVFRDKVRFMVYDRYISEYSNLQKVIEKCSILFAAVPTPMNRDGSIDISHVEDVLEKISLALKKRSTGKRNPIVVLRSTIVPGTTRDLQKKFSGIRLVFNPEFLSERNSLADMERTDRVIIGGRPADCKKVEEVYRQVFPQARYIITDTTTAEMIKYAANVTLAGQVMIANELFQICRKLNLDWAFIRNAVILDPLMGRNTKVPGPDGGLGFGGRCLPKDLNALVYLSKTLGYRPQLLEQVWKSNLLVRKNRDWENIKGATSYKKEMKKAGGEAESELRRDRCGTSKTKQ